jgi:hypothetical protein
VLPGCRNKLQSPNALLMFINLRSMPMGAIGGAVKENNKERGRFNFETSTALGDTKM